MSVSPARKKRKRSSTVWLHFDENQEDKTAECRYCDKIYASTFSTTTMLKHLHANHQEYLESTDTISIEDRILNWIIHSLVPFNCVNSEYFKLLFNEKVPSSATIWLQLSARFSEERIKMRKKLVKNTSLLSFTHDIWTGLNGRSYLGIITNYVDNNFQLRTHLIGMKEIESHSGKNIADLFCSTIQDFGIQAQKIGYITTDNASNNDTFFTEMGKKLKIKEPAEKHVRCMAHVINLVVKDFLNEKTTEEEPVLPSNQPRRKRKSIRKKKNKYLFHFLLVYSFYPRFVV